MSIGNIFKRAIGGAAGWIGGAIGGAVGGPGGAKVGSMIGSKFATSLMTKKPGHGQWAPIDTSVKAPSLGEYSMNVQAMGEAKSPDMRLKTVNGDTLNAEWESRLEKWFRKKDSMYT